MKTLSTDEEKDKARKDIDAFIKSKMDKEKEDLQVEYGFGSDYSAWVEMFSEKYKI